MNELIALEKNLQSIGAKAYLEDDKLKIEAPAGSLSAEIKAQLKIHKEAIIDGLRVLSMRDFCGLCKIRLVQRGVQWHCPNNCR